MREVASFIMFVAFLLGSLMVVTTTAKGAYLIEDYRVIDGDTIRARVKLGLGVSKTIDIRLARYNSPETRTRDLIEKKYGKLSALKITSILHTCLSIYLSSNHKGKYSRYMGELMCGKLSVNDEMIAFERKQRKLIKTERDSLSE